MRVELFQVSRRVSCKVTVQTQAVLFVEASSRSRRTGGVKPPEITSLIS